MIDLSNLNVQKNDFISKFLNNISKFKRVMLWGLSESADAAIEFFTEHNIKVDGIYDNDKSKSGTLYKGVEIFYPGDDVFCEDTALVITCSYYENIRLSLIDRDPDIDNRMFMYDGYFKDNEYLYDNDKVLSLINKNYDELGDDKSKVLYEALLKYRYIRDIRIIKELYESRSECYLDKVFLDRFKDGLYLDVGSYNADFVTTLSDRVDVSNSKFYIFEPNKIFSKNIEDNLSGKYNLNVFKMALCDEEGKMAFQQIASSTSHLVDKKYNAYRDKLDNNVEYVKTNKLDNVINNEKVFGIKVDIEGAEMSMLIGATEVIKRDRPIMMISIYHRWNDLWEIQDYISGLNLNYIFYIRHYSLSVAKTILYCIPE